MQNLLYENMKKFVDLSEEEFSLCLSYFQTKKLKKGDFLHQANEYNSYASFVQDGLFRTYIIDEKGKEHILQFATNGWWASDLASFITGKPSKFYIEALEDSEVFWISKNSWDILLKKVPLYMNYHRQLLELGFIATQNRLIESYSIDAKKKYENLISTFPNIINRVPLYMIASYLGMSRETLSRVRNQITFHK